MKKILQFFEHASGLEVNFSKSYATLIRCGADEAAPAVDLLGYPIMELPITHMGIPLTLQ